MCLGMPGRIVGRSERHPDLAVVEIEGVEREVNVALLDDDVEIGSWVLVHMGVAMAALTAEEAEATLDFLAMLSGEGLPVPGDAPSAG